jgi:hypothetical protein
MIYNPTLEEAMNKSPFDKVDTPLGTMERWRAEALIIGTTSGIVDVYRTIRDDAASQVARADATEARNALIQHLCAKVDAFESKLDNLVAQVAAEREARRADAVRQAKLDEEEIELPPDVLEKQTLSPPSKIGDATETHHPTGELHSLEPKEEPEDPDLPSVVGDDDDDDQGDLPEELTKGVAPAPSTYPTLELPHPPIVEQPVSISLNKE